MEGVVLVVCSLIVAMAYCNPVECPAKCECDSPRITCEGGTISILDKRLTALVIQDADPPITTLNHAITQQLEHLVKLQLDSVGLTEIDPGALATIQRLETLEITNNRIATIGPATFRNCGKLIYLNLENNNIEVIEEGTFTSLDNLHHLNLSHNALTTLPKYLPTRLQVLDVEYNRISEVQDLSSASMTSLNLCHNDISHIDPDQIELKNLKSLCIGGIKFNLSDDLVNHNKLPVLESLQLKGDPENKLRVTNKIQENILNMTTQSLKNLELSYCGLASPKIFTQANSKLQNLKATDVKLVPTRLSLWPKFELPKIEILDLSGSPYLTKLFLTSNAPTTLPDLKILKMSHCWIRDFPESHFEQKTPNVKQLDISHNPLECTCYGISWIPNYVRYGKLILLNEENTICAIPKHLKDIPLLTASLCPIIPTPDTTSTPATYTTSLVTSVDTTVIPEESHSSSPGMTTTNKGNLLLVSPVIIMISFITLCVCLIV
ncbi:vasorin-like [Homarus americanus]|uniref:vasorin-like n=1 Tax=Homarus americanus TaxID=6706 RepID=UPI001C447DF7|nr:vasorin-like [Homarus americanus]